MTQCIDLQIINNGSVARLNTHRHNNIFEIRIVGNGDQCGRIGVTQFYADLFIFQISQNIQKIGDVESDIDTVTAIVESISSMASS